MSENLPTNSAVVVIGGGIVGCSVAYHLAHLGIEVLLLEQHQLTAGTTWHAAGLLSEFRPTRRLTELAKYSMALYAGLEKETDQATGLKRNGSLSIATNPQRLEELRRGVTLARAQGISAREIAIAELENHWPLLNTDDVTGAVLYPNDGQINPVDVTMALARGARQKGAQIVEGITVTNITTRLDQVTGVSTTQGEVKCDQVVNCTGMWAREFGKRSNVDIPVQACEHFYCLTEVIANLPADLPVLRDYDGCAYYKEDAGKLLVGAFEPIAKPWSVDGIPEGFAFAELPDDLEHLMPILEQATRRVPILNTLGFSKFFNGPESFTPDDRYLLGEVPELRGYFVAAGFNSIGIQSAGGAGQVLAQWIKENKPPVALWDVDIRRVFSFQSNSHYLSARVSESLGLLYAMHWPYRQYATSRNIFKSPIHDSLLKAKAVMGELAGWERANWYAGAGEKPEYVYSYGPQNWFAAQKREHVATRNNVAIYDQTSFAKFDVVGPDAETWLQYLSANDISGDIGKLTYTQWLNTHAGIEADLTIARIGECHFRVITAAATRRKDWCWLNQHIPKNAKCTTSDITFNLATISVMGPRSRELLTSLVEEPINNTEFPFGTGQSLIVAGVQAWAQRITFVGELGWELYVANTNAEALLGQLLETGRPLNVQLAGYHALDSCRIEKAYRHWGHDISDADTPIEAGLSFACAFDKPMDFIGREALLRTRDKGVRRRLVQLRLAGELFAYHDEPIFRDGKMVGHVTSANYGHTLDAPIALGYVQSPDIINNPYIDSGEYEVEIGGLRIPAEVSRTPMYDPKSARVRS